MTLLIFISMASGCALWGEKRVPMHRRPAIELFSPVYTAGVKQISQAEAQKLAKRMLPHQQGLKSWQDLGFALEQSLSYARAKPSTSVAFEQPGLTVTYAEIVATLEHIKTQLPKLSPSILSSQFTWYRIGPDFGVTGYYEPTLYASRQKSPKYSYPLYRLPGDLQKGKAYYSREEIDRMGALQDKGLEIAWVTSETDAFFLHIQGSGRLVFDDGTTSHILYAGKNNQPYRSLGRIMVEQGFLEPSTVSMRTVKETLRAYPEKKSEFFDSNPSYVFFREKSQGPIGAMGKPLTPYVSVASDPRMLPYGSLAFMVTPLPDAKGDLNVPFYGMILPQDTGGAIKKNRVDLFCGPGEKAEHTAGYLDSPGAIYLLLKK